MMKAKVRGRINNVCKYCRRKDCSWWKRFVHRFVLCDDWTWTNPDKEYFRNKWYRK